MLSAQPPLPIALFNLRVRYLHLFLPTFRPFHTVVLILVVCLERVLRMFVSFVKSPFCLGYFVFRMVFVCWFYCNFLGLFFLIAGDQLLFLRVLTFLSLCVSCTTLLTDSSPYFQPVSSQTPQPNPPLTSFGSSRTSTCSWTVLQKTSVPVISHQESCASPPCTSHIKLVLNVVWEVF